MCNRVLYFLSFVLLFFSSCANPNKTQEFINKNQSQLPVSMGEIGDITSLIIDGKYVVMTALVDDSNPYISDIFTSPYPKMSIDYSLREKGLFNMCKTFIADGYGLIFRYKGRYSRKNLDVTYSVAELKQIQLKGIITKKESSEYRLKQIVNYNNSQLPIAVDEYTTLKQLRVGSQNLEFVYELKENEDFKISYITDDLKGLKNTFFKDIKESKDLAFIAILASAVEAEKGFTITYVGNLSRESVTFNYTYSELKNNYNIYLSDLKLLTH